MRRAQRALLALGSSSGGGGGSGAGLGRGACGVAARAGARDVGECGGARASSGMLGRVRACSRLA